MANETLKKIEYNSIDQLLMDLNYNFGVVQNSPLYKGIIGIDGTSVTGDSGSRGSSFLFVNLAKFQAQFPAQLTTGSDITINYINSKLLDFASKNKLLVALGVDELVNNDIIVLTNSMMTTFNFVDNRITSTGMSFNESTNISQKIDQLVADAVAEGLANNPILNSLQNVFATYNTLAKNYADTNNTHTTTSVLPTSVYSPYIPNYTSDGIVIPNHKYFGYTDEKFPVNDNGTFIFGSIKRYYQILQNTVNTDTAQTLTSDYATGVNNIPSMVVMQDTTNAGILLGYKNNTNLKRFASIYKNDLHELVLESDSGNNPSEYSRLLLHKDYMKYAKLVQFGNDLEVSRDTQLFGDVNSKGYRTGKFTVGAGAGNNFNQLVTEIGNPTSAGNTKTKIVSTTVDLNEYKSNVLVTDINGVVLKTHSLEIAVPSETTPMIGFNALETNIVNLPTKVLTSNYYNYLARKINVISAFTNANYWKKSDFNTGVIPSLHLYNTLTVDGDVQLGGLLNVNTAEMKVQTFGNLLDIQSVDVSMSEYKSKVLVTDANGKILKTYALELANLTANDLVSGNALTSIGASANNFITTKYYDHLLKKINLNNSDLASNYWSKSQFASTTGVAGNIRVGVNNVLEGLGGGMFGLEGQTLLRVVNIAGKHTVNIGHTTSETNMFGDIFLRGKPNKVLVTDADGKVLDTKSIETVKYNETTDLVAMTAIPNSVGTNDNTFAMGYHINWIARKINNIISWINTNIWTKAQFTTGAIPTLVLSDTLIAKAIRIGATDLDPNFYTDGGTDTVVGKSNGNTILRGNVRLSTKPSIVVVTDNNGNVINNTLENSVPSSSTHPASSLGNTEAQIETAYYEKDSVEPLYGEGSTRPQNFVNYPVTASKHITSNYFDLIVSHVKVIRKLLYNRPTFAYCDENYGGSGGGVPNGMIMYWTNHFSTVIPEGWVICDGRIIPGLNVPTPAMIDKFIVCSLTPNVIDGNTDHRATLITSNLPAHTHYIPSHTHTYDRAIKGRQYRTNDGDAPFGVYETGTTGYGGSGYTYSEGSGIPFSIKPRSISAIPIMKFWDGRGTMPTITMPPFANITGITQVNKTANNEITVNFSRVDQTVTSAMIQMKRPDGSNPNQWVGVSVINMATNSYTMNMNTDTYTGTFRLVALNGNSYGTNGVNSNEFVANIAWTAPPVPAIPPKPYAIGISYTGSFNTANEKIRLDWSINPSALPVQYYEVQFATRVNSGVQTAYTLLGKVYSANQKWFEVAVQSPTNPAQTRYMYYKVRAVDTNNNEGAWSDIVQIALNRNFENL